MAEMKKLLFIDFILSFLSNTVDVSDFLRSRDGWIMNGLTGTHENGQRTLKTRDIKFN